MFVLKRNDFSPETPRSRTRLRPRPGGRDHRHLDQSRSAHQHYFSLADYLHKAFVAWLAEMNCDDAELSGTTAE